MRDWTEARRPAEDPREEERRKAAYWDWLSRTAATLTARGAAVAPATHGSWHRLTSPQDADFEAVHMQHSIGHSWDLYSGFGDLYSLRDADGIPQATVLVSDGVVVHAREQQNARLSPENLAELRAFAAERGWAVKPDPLRFDTLFGNDGPNTRVTLVERRPEGKRFLAFTVAGRMSPEQAREVHDAFGADPDAPATVSAQDVPVLPDWDGAGTLEVLSVRYVSEEPTADRSLEEVVRTLSGPETARFGM